ncbi:hypothetical protein DFH09DRAFT_1402648 [Mycena vulgaris]|nr:hypothetical protein DFH09DRAFT_1402648 [Mycena vulgaris]
MTRTYPPLDSLVQVLLNYFHQLLEFQYTHYGTISASEIVLRITSNFLNIRGLLLNRLQHQHPAAVETIYCILYLNSFSRLAGPGRTHLMDHIAYIQPLPSELKAFYITEIFSSRLYHPIPNPAVLVEQAIKHLPHFDEPDVKCSTGRFYNSLGLYYRAHNDFSKATRYYQTELSLAISTGNTRRQCQSSINLAYLQGQVGDPAAGQMYASEVQRLAKISADLYNEAQALDIEAQCWLALGNYKYAVSLCSRARHLLFHCGMSAGDLNKKIMSTQAETYKLKSEYGEARDIHTQILHGAPVELAPYLHAFTLLNVAEVEVFLDVPMEDVERKIYTAKSIFNSLGRQQVEMINYCLERLGDRSLWGSTDWPSSWTIVYLVHASKSQQKLDVHKALQFLGDVFCTEGDPDTAVSLLTVALEGFTQMDVHRSRAEFSASKKVALIDEELLSIAGDMLKDHTQSLTLLSEIHAPNAALEVTTGSLIEEIGETENPGLREGKVLVPVIHVMVSSLQVPSLGVGGEGRGGTALQNGSGGGSMGAGWDSGPEERRRKHPASLSSSRRRRGGRGGAVCAPFPAKRALTLLVEPAAVNVESRSALSSRMSAAVLIVTREGMWVRSYVRVMRRRRRSMQILRRVGTGRRARAGSVCAPVTAPCAVGVGPSTAQRTRGNRCGGARKIRGRIRGMRRRYGSSSREARGWTTRRAGVMAILRCRLGELKSEREREWDVMRCEGRVRGIWSRWRGLELPQYTAKLLNQSEICLHLRWVQNRFRFHFSCSSQEFYLHLLLLNTFGLLQLHHRSLYRRGAHCAALRPRGSAHYWEVSGGWMIFQHAAVPGKQSSGQRRRHVCVGDPAVLAGGIFGCNGIPSLLPSRSYEVHQSQ